ncbi:Hsp20/alpha crystallin family protein [Sphingobacteriales bacterium CHB3]|nr:Hsp20/alpha crystallin family protein [Sphingobacteriales bacterium CHB3]
MSLVRWNPVRDLATFPSDIVSMQKEINHMFDRFFRGGTLEEGDIMPTTWLPAVDLVEKDNEFVAKVELPGVNKDDVKITLQENILTIRGEKKEEKETKESSYHRLERSYGSFQRSFTLPTTVKADKVEAQYKDGILTINLPKAEEAKRKQIEVKVR